MPIQGIATAVKNKWEGIPETFHPPVLTTAQKICRVVWNVLSVLIPIIGLYRLIAYGIGRLAHRAFLPAMFYDEETKQFYRKLFQTRCLERSPHFEVIHQKVETPDGAKLDVTLFRHRNGNAETPTTLYFGGNGMLKGMNGGDWILEESLENKIPMNLVVFDYRSVGDSEGTFNGAKDLLVDGATVVRWIRDFVKTPDHLIHFHGMSLGGGVALKVKAADPKLTGNLLHERSFSSIEEVIRAHAARLGCWLKPFVPLVVSIAKNQDLELDAVADVNKLKGPRLFVHHVEDPIILHLGSLAIKMPRQETYELKGGDAWGDHHCLPIHFYDGARKTVSTFMFA